MLELPYCAIGIRDLVGDDTRHAVHPQPFGADTAVNVGVDGLQKGDGFLQLGGNRGHELQQRFGVVGGDIRVGQRRAETLGVRFLRQQSVVVHPQAFLFDTAADVAQGRGRTAVLDAGEIVVKRLGQGVHSSSSIVEVAWARIVARLGVDGAYWDTIGTTLTASESCEIHAYHHRSRDGRCSYPRNSNSRGNLIAMVRRDDAEIIALVSNPRREALQYAPAVRERELGPEPDLR